MPMNRILFQPGMSLSQFLELYGTEEQCEAALEQTRWPDGFRCPRCGAQEHGLVYGRRHRRYQCRSCRHQTLVTAGTIMEATKLPLTKWFQAFYLVGHAKTGISSLSLMRKLGVNYRTAWLLHNKNMQAMSERENPMYCGEEFSWMTLTWAENTMAASLVEDQRTRCRSSLPSPLMRLVTPFT